MELSSVILTTGGSVGFFRLLNAGVRKLPMPESACRNAWKWRNISTSFVHSFITAIWAVLCFFRQPQMAEDLIETHSVFSHALVSFSIGDRMFRLLCADFPLRGLFRGGPDGRDKLRVPPPQANAAYGWQCHRHAVPGQQHHQPGHVRGVPHQHAGLDDPLAGAQQGQRAPPGLHAGQRRHGHHDGHEYCAVLSGTQERLFEEQHPGEQEREGNVESRGHEKDYN